MASLISFFLMRTALAEWENYWPLLVLEKPECGPLVCKENVMGPLFERVYTEKAYYNVVRPIAMYKKDLMWNEEFNYFLYPLFSQHKFEGGWSWNFFNMWMGSRVCGEEKLTLFPFFFFKKTSDPCTSYSGFFPIVGTVQNFLGKDAVSWLAFPFYLRTQKQCTVRHAMPWPFLQLQMGPGSGGSAIWPLIGTFWREGDYRYTYLLWPLIYERYDHLSSPCPSVRRAFLPFFAYEDSHKRFAVSVLWPFFSHIEMRNRNYVEDQFLWPFIVQGRGDNEYVNRFAPFYTHSIRRGHDKKWFMWPFVKVQHREECGLCVSQQQFLYFLFWRQSQQSIENPSCPPAEKVHVWPLLSYWDNGAGQKQLQFFSPLEVFFPTNEAVRMLYSPLFSIMRFEQRVPGHTRASFLFDLIAVETTPTSSRFSLGPLFEVENDECKSEVQILKGFLGFKKENGKKSLKILWMSL
ncbi:MAG: hypothetical protein C5B43_02350 [Verrucomicrobia bacterium]|nr:MAG: hypothetical protein C5B43_02350 [Verrucomicrobiota bacterium]